MSKKSLVLWITCAALLPVAGDLAAQTTYASPIHTFSVSDVLGGRDGVTYANDPTIICTAPPCPGNAPYTQDGDTLFPIDSSFTFDVIDFVGGFERDRDGVYEEGWAGNFIDPSTGLPIGLWVSNATTSTFKAPSPMGTWCAGLGGEAVKCSSEHFTVMEHVLTCDETVPYFYYDPETGLPSDPVYSQCEDLELIPDEVIAMLAPNESSVLQDIAVGSDYAVTLKDDGKPLYRWGTLVKRPTDVRAYARIPLPSEWSAPEAVFRVLSAELQIVHATSNNPNEQVRPEDFENEAATGRLPGFVEGIDGSWTSTQDCFESDGDAIAVGTVLRNPDFGRPGAPSADLRDGLTNAWYTTLDRDPFEDDPVTGRGPRWRLKANKFGQDVPGLEIPLIHCSSPPFSHDNIKYPVGEVTTTTLNLLDWVDGETSPLADSLGWRAFLDGDDGSVDGLSPEGIPLTNDFDLAIYVKGEGKPTLLYNAQLHIVYEPMTEGGLK